MNLNIIEKRFEELINRINEVDKTIKKYDTSADEIEQEQFMSWAISCLALLRQVFGENSIHYRYFNKELESFNGWIASYYINCKSIFKAAFEDYSGGYIFTLRGLITADIMDDGLTQAEDLLDSGYKDPACVIAGACLETSLKELCDRQNIPHAKLDKMNADLKKTMVYNTGMQKQITAWADRRNNAAHGNWSEYTKEDVKSLIDGIRDFIARYL